LLEITGLSEVLEGRFLQKTTVAFNSFAFTEKDGHYVFSAICIGHRTDSIQFFADSALQIEARLVNCGC